MLHFAKFFALPVIIALYELPSIATLKLSNQANWTCVNFDFITQVPGIKNWSWRHHIKTFPPLIQISYSKCWVIWHKPFINALQKGMFLCENNYSQMIAYMRMFLCAIHLHLCLEKCDINYHLHQVNGVLFCFILFLLKDETLMWVNFLMSRVRIVQFGRPNKICLCAPILPKCQGLITKVELIHSSLSQNSWK